ncbi:MAG: DUF1552 domain-containing protein [Oligoflexales bacterium]
MSHQRLNSNFKSLAQSPLLSREDQQRLQIHMELLNDFRRKTNNNGNCDIEFEPNPGNQNEIVNDYIDLIATTIKCDISRVISFNLTETADNKSFSFLPGGSLEGFHRFTHTTSTPENVFQLEKIQRWHSSKILRLMDALNEVEDQETGATYLDNSLIYWGSEQAVKFNERGLLNVHTSEDMPVFLAGKCGGNLRAGRFLDYRQPGQHKMFPKGGQGSDLCNRTSCWFGEDFPGIGKPLNELLITIMMAMGLNHTEWENESDPGFGDYSDNIDNQYDFGDKRSPIQEIKA